MAFALPAAAVGAAEPDRRRSCTRWPRRCRTLARRATAPSTSRRTVLSRSKGSDVHRRRRPRELPAPGDRPRRVGAHVGAPGRLHRRDGDDPGRRLHRRRPRAPRARPASSSRPRFANIAGMQDVLYFHDPEADFEPELVVIYTPGLAAAGYPDDRLIAVNLDLHVTRVFNSDYFGESKKGGLRMWNKLVHERGGLALHAGLQGHPDAARRPRRPDRRPLGHGQDDHHLHAPERLAAGAGRLRRVVARRHGLGHRGRLLRQDVRAQPEGRAHDLRRGHAPGRLPRERQQSDAGEVDFFDQELHQERPRGVRVRRHRGGRRVGPPHGRTSCSS